MAAAEPLGSESGSTSTVTTTILQRKTATASRKSNTRTRHRRRPERSVRLSSAASGGTATGRRVNQWGKMEDPQHRQVRKGVGKK